MPEQGSILLGAIADDMTGATDLALMLARGGMATVQVIGPDAVVESPPGTEAVVVAMKSRTNPPEDAIRMSLAACETLLERGARQILFKYCSTFDSTDRGNIGPVADALLERLGAHIAVACPAFPATGRTIYRGHLFVNGRLLSESGMENHPLTPMTDPDLVRVLSRQSRNPVGLVPLESVTEGPEGIRNRLAALASEGVRLAIADAVADADLLSLGEALSDAPLITGGSGIALGLPKNFRRQGLLAGDATGDFSPPAGPAAILSGSCSVATNEQVARALDAGIPGFRLTPEAAMNNDGILDEILGWASERRQDGPVLIHATAPPAKVQAAQAAFGREAAGAAVEGVMGALAAGLVANGVRRLVVAGGETSGAVLGALGTRALRIGPEIAPGVPWTLSVGERPLALALKSGNFGGPDFFRDALGMIGS
ncbi:MAG: 3-oxo-tetronate kinase [Minwuia sp.]|uniref:3-oxo-tetronate kinase n=1 Tax=Minwuia sp. TaxID=2493630 RepID=UPI003A8A464F